MSGDRCTVLQNTQQRNPTRLNTKWNTHKCISENVGSNRSIVERPFKEAQHKLTVERDIVFSADTIVLPQILRKDIIKRVHHDIHGRVTVMQKKI